MRAISNEYGNRHESALHRQNRKKPTVKIQNRKSVDEQIFHELWKTDDVKTEKPTFRPWSIRI